METRARAIAPVVEVTYNGRDISADLAPYLVRWSYVDRMSGETDTLDISLGETRADVTRWLGEWYPDKGMEIACRYGWAHQDLVPTGAHEVDEIEVSSPPMTIRIRAQSAGVSRLVRTRIGRAYEHTTLSGVLHQIAGRIGAQLAGQIDPDPAIERVTQYQETDWQFATRLAREYGYTVKLVENNRRLAVSRLTADQPPVRVLRPSDISHYSYRDQITAVPSRAVVRRHDERTGALVARRADAQGQTVPADVTAADEHVKIARAADASDAEARARAEMDRRLLDKTILEATLPGDPLLAAGLTVDVLDLGRASGRYVIVEARHDISRSGYATSLQLKRIGNAA